MVLELREKIIITRRPRTYLYLAIAILLASPTVRVLTCLKLNRIQVAELAEIKGCRLLDVSNYKMISAK